MKTLNLALVALALALSAVAHATDNGNYTTHGSPILVTLYPMGVSGVDCYNLTSAEDSLTIGVTTDVSTNITEYTGANIESIGTNSGTVGDWATGPTAAKVGLSPKEASGCGAVVQILESFFDTVGASTLQVFARDGDGDFATAFTFVDMTAVAPSVLGEAVGETDCTGASADTLCYQAYTIGNSTNTAVTATIPSDLDTIAAGLTGRNLWSGTIATVTDTVTLITSDVPDGDDLHAGRPICVVAANYGTTHNADCTVVDTVNEGTETWTLTEAFGFTPLAGDSLYVPMQDVNVQAFDKEPTCFTNGKVTGC